MLRPEFLKNLAGRNCDATRRIFESLADSLVDIGAGRDIKEPLTGFGILDNRFGFAFYRQHHRRLLFLRCFMKIIVAPFQVRGFPVGRQRRRQTAIVCATSQSRAFTISLS